MSQGHHKLLEADSTAKQAREAIKQSNKVRKALGRYRYELSQSDTAEAQSTLRQAISDHTLQLHHWEAQGLKLRQDSAEQKTESLKLLRAGMIANWSSWISQPGPLRGAELTSPLDNRSHNSPQRSVHRNMPTPRSDTELQSAEGMSLQVSALAGQQLPEGLDTGSFSVSRQRKIFAHIELIQDRSQFVPINQLHRWRLILSSLDGEAITDGQVRFGGHMPGHVHGLPTQPIIEAGSAPGVYEISGVKFQMGGWWVIELELETSVGSDSVRFNVVL